MWCPLAQTHFISIHQVSSRRFGCLTCETAETADSTCNPMISRFTPCFICLPFAFLFLPPFPGCSLFPFLLSSYWKTSLIFLSSHALWHLDREVQNCPRFFFFRAIGLRLLRNHEAWQAFDMLDISGLLEIWAAVPWLATGGSSER